MNQIALIAALPGELKPLVHSWTHHRRNGIDVWRKTIGRTEWIAVCAGAGREAAKRAFHEARLAAKFSRVYSVGFAGALRPEFQPGTACAVSGIIDTATGERFTAAGPVASCVLLTHHRVADRPEKAQLAATHAGDLVDMEAAEVARQALAQGIEFRCVKGVSDGCTDRLPDLNRFITPAGHFQLARFVGFAALRPQLWPGLIRLGRNSRRAAEALAAYLQVAIDAEPRRL